MIARLRRRLALGFAAAFLGLLLLFAALGHLGLRAALRARMDEGNAHLVAPVAAAFAGGGPGAALQAFETLAPAPGERVALLDRAGNVVAWRGRFAPTPAGPPVAGIAVRVDEGAGAGGSWRALTAPLGGGWVRAEHSQAEASWLLACQLVVSGVLGAILALLAWAAGERLAAWAAEPVEEALARERALTRDASHELRTPLAVIQGQADLAAGLAGLPAPAAEKLAIIRRTATRMGLLVGDLLTLGRAEAAGLEGGLRFSLADLVEEAVELLAPLARARGVGLLLAPPADPAEVWGDPERLAQAVHNLLDNAIRYTPPGGRVDVTLARQGAQRLLRVENDGPPIPTGERAAIFERFHRAPAGRLANPAGNGLGLAIARAAAQAHGGELTLASAPGARTAFVLALPPPPAPDRFSQTSRGGDTVGR